MTQTEENNEEIPTQGPNSSQAQDIPVDSVILPPQTPAADSRPFISRFSKWMKAIAFVVLATFIPDQVSWAFGYNPAILYKNLPSFAMQDASMPMPKPALQVAGSLEYLLKQIQDKQKLRLQLNLDNASSQSSSVPSHSVGRAREGGHT